MSEAPIGVFDSGVGGLTVAREIRAQLPGESLLYVGDTEHTPYGPKPIADVRRLSLAILDELVEQDVKMLVIACNTASAAVLRDARERYDVPVVEVIAPAVRAAVSATHNNRIGVLGTEATVSSRAYDDAFAAAPHLEIFSQACPMFVEYVERGDTTSPELVRYAEEYLAPIKAAGVDTVVLGCTHYPFLKGVLGYVLGPGVRLVSSDVETAQDVYRVLASNGLLNSSGRAPQYSYRATGENTEAFVNLAGRFLGPDVRHVERLMTEAINLPPSMRRA
ncbi:MULTISPECIES: glutamate racemase [Pseudoclavibacter]|uniref:Glutamate racemase n=1 Tax=Pseudoclavibacter terrae TaxID=1530195 RepID=A0A7J5B681_9MICO|nr:MULTISPECIES: glutamate racemase [Pseudoclavibacter]KAB1639695.1 glutamate racemase [Pseudoclavibacter terrae]NYF13322.1 glutamate racemase [Pseudoclavibacter sp. JAI123]PPG39503.1 glutamate racemase [Pseudoclavibacter sp. RFBA6]